MKKGITEKQHFFLIIKLIILIMAGNIHPFNAQTKPSEDRETDPQVVKNLEEWQDLKFGFMMHWGPYSQWGVVESWSLCSEDEPWCRRNMDNYVEYVKAYEKLKDTFNPVKFNPESWAKLAKEAGMKYLVFTTKHHDGFCMFDTKLTDYRITDVGCAFHTHPKANITKELFEAFRKEGFKVGAYFSKPDWHCEYYWWPYFSTPDRNVNYDPAKYPERWQKYKDYTYGQIEELMSGYGKVNILWLDGGWVRPRSTLTRDIMNWAGKKTYNQDIKMPKIANMAREHQPGLIIVDRTVTGKYENYRTPEQHVPHQALDYPWETCMTMGGSWSYNPNDQYKSTHKIIHLLVDIVAKGGNYLLNVGPDPNGELPSGAIQRMKEIGHWMKINGEAIYNTRPIPPYKEGKTCLTSLKDGTAFAIYLADEDEHNPPGKILLETIQPDDGTEVFMLGYNKPLQWEKVGKGVLIEVPEAMVQNPPCQHAWAFKISTAKSTRK
ncbi:MAG: alpha-L-fucosidase [Bacteroidales bacterium]|nr:alpha-L-fucosidase [Bacteroidales bacterium]